MTGEPADRRDVPPYVALVRIAAVVGMSTVIAFGIFLLLLGTDYIAWALLSMALALPFFALMRFAERNAEQQDPPPDP
jgi:hypothetical protein